MPLMISSLIPARRPTMATPRIVSRQTTGWRSTATPTKATHTPPFPPRQLARAALPRHQGGRPRGDAGLEQPPPPSCIGGYPA
ncbi:MAG: hypothetical protein M5R42_04455 [Rhodocyclaceae bacterium]|nr:hypothetical protein [Rhodocyclaceae bacterium]